MKKCVINNDSVEYIDMSQEEIDYANGFKVPFHYQRQFRLLLSKDIADNILREKSLNEISGKYPNAEFLVNHIKERKFETEFDSEYTYIYLDRIDPKHEPILRGYGILIEENQNGKIVRL